MSNRSERRSPENDSANNIVVSVIIPIFNVEKYIGACLDSILNQSLSEIEVICIDDGSTDNSPSLVESYGQRDARIRIITQPNRGQSAARNQGISEARGQYIYFMDADDVLDRQALDILVQIAIAERLDVIYFDAKPFIDNDELQGDLEKYERNYKRSRSYELVREGTTLFAQMVTNNDYQPSPCMQLINTQFLHETNVLFYEGIIHEDNLFSFEVILAARRARHLKNTLFHRRIRQGSTMTNMKTAANFYGYTVCAAQMLRINFSRDYSPDVRAAVQAQIIRMFERAIRIFESLDSTQKDTIRFAHGTNEALILELVRSRSARSAIRNLTRRSALGRDVDSQFDYFVEEAEKLISTKNYKGARALLRRALAVKNDKAVRSRLRATNKYWFIRALSFSKPLDQK